MCVLCMEVISIVSYEVVFGTHPYNGVYVVFMYHTVCGLLDAVHVFSVVVSHVLWGQRL